MTSKLLSSTFKSIKPRNNLNNINLKQINQESCPSQLNLNNKISSKSSKSSSDESSSWFVYLILSTNPPIKTYVGVTTDFTRRLREHNGELQGGAKASRAGRPWICACLIEGFVDRSQACVFESRWKSLSRKLNRKKRSGEGHEADDVSLPLLRHRNAALEQVKESTDCSHLKINWHLNPS